MTKTMVVFSGGSSRSFKRAFAASPWPEDKRWASKISTIFRPDVSLFRYNDFLNSRMDWIKILFALDIWILKNGSPDFWAMAFVTISRSFWSILVFSRSVFFLGVGIGKINFRFSCCRRKNRLQDGQFPQESSEPDSQFNSCANWSAVPSFPQPGWPEKR